MRSGRCTPVAKHDGEVLGANDSVAIDINELRNSIAPRTKQDGQVLWPHDSVEVQIAARVLAGIEESILVGVAPARRKVAGIDDAVAVAVRCKPFSELIAVWNAVAVTVSAALIGDTVLIDIV